MALDAIVEDFRRKVCEQIRLEPEGLNRFRIFTPFRFDDGDHLVMVLKQLGGNWVLSDEGHTYMRLTYDLDEKSLRQERRQEIITGALNAFSVDDHDGELVLAVRDGRFGERRRWPVRLR